MNKKSIIILFSFTLCFLCASIVLSAPDNNKNIVSTAVNNDANNINSKLIIYDSLQLNELGLSRAAFEKAIKGYSYLLATGKIKNENIISIIDFSLSSDKKRLFVIDLQNGELLYNTFVAHGKKSGQKLPTIFSNKMESKKSSLGFFVTGETYVGHCGYSMRLQGEEKGINDNAFRRGIVMHSAAYVDENIIEGQGFIGRSFGCTAIPANIYKEIIGTIQNGTCLFIYSPDKFYETHSQIIKQIKA